MEKPFCCKALKSARRSKAETLTDPRPVVWLLSTKPMTWLLALKQMKKGDWPLPGCTSTTVLAREQLENRRLPLVGVFAEIADAAWSSAWAGSSSCRRRSISDSTMVGVRSRRL
jgi:hypothetical protein